MPDRLTGTDAKIERAKKHIRDFKAAEKRFFKLEPYKVVAGNELGSGDLVYVLQGRREPPPYCLSTIAGDAISNLRASLDHLFSQLMDINGKTSGPGDYFPIADGGKQYKALMQGVKKKVGCTAMKLMEGAEAYKGGKCDGLWQINYLNNADKHRLLIALVVRMLTIQEGNPFTVTRPVNVVLEHGKVLDRILAANRGKVEAERTFTFEISFSEPDIAQGQPVLPTLTDYLELTEGVIQPFRVLLC
jgi:hypothetical protein